MSNNTTSSAILSALHGAGITHLFVNLGSDHPAMLDAFARKSHKLAVITSPNEMNALSAAHGFAQVTGKPAAVLVHVECGTQALAGAVHNASKGRIPVIILAGTSPVTQEGEMRGSRNEYIHWLQDVPDQRAIVRQYMRYDHEIRSGRNATQIIYRSLQFAMSDPKGPVYLIASRETLEEEVVIAVLDSKPSLNYSLSLPIELIGLTPEALNKITSALLNARAPLLVTSYLGRNPSAFKSLVQLVNTTALAVHESCPTYNNFPSVHWAHQGHTWNPKNQLPALAEADVVIVVDSDVPWIAGVSKPSDTAKIFHLDCDPLKDDMTLWQLPAVARYRVDSAVALEQILSSVVEQLGKDKPNFNFLQSRITLRTNHLQSRASHRFEALATERRAPQNGNITVPNFVFQASQLLPPNSTILNESISNAGLVAENICAEKPLQLIGSGGSSLGWWSGAAVGMKLAFGSTLDSFLVAFIGDGTFLFGAPASAYWMAKKYNTPFLTVVWNNGGWFSPKASYLGVYPKGPGKDAKGLDLNIGIQPAPDFGKIAEGAGGAWSAKVTKCEEVEKVLKEAIEVVKSGRCAVVEVVLPQI